MIQPTAVAAARSGLTQALGPAMQIVAAETLAKIAALAASPITPVEYAVAAEALVGDASLASRIIEWLPEAFGLVLASHVDQSLTLPTTFMVKDGYGTWKEFAFTADPVFSHCLNLALSYAHHGPQEVFRALALASSTMDVINNALNQGASLQGEVIQPIRMLRLSAETYSGA